MRLAPNLVLVPTLVTVSLGLALAQPTGGGLGEEEFGNGTVSSNEEWPAGLLTVANDKHRVYRRWINGNEDFCFVGKAEALNAALVTFAKVEGGERHALLLPVRGAEKSFEDITVHLDWRMNAMTGIAKFYIEREFAGSPVHTTAPVLYVHLDGDEGAARAQDLELPDGLLVLGPAEIIERAQDALASELQAARAEAAHQLGWFAHDKTVRATLVKLLEDDERTVRVAAAAGLSRTLDPPAGMIDALTRMREATEDQWESGRLGSMVEELGQREAATPTAIKGLLRRDVELRKLLAARKADDTDED